jgi:hypothetical protein
MSCDAFVKKEKICFRHATEKNTTRCFDPNETHQTKSNLVMFAMSLGNKIA